MSAFVLCIVLAGFSSILASSVPLVCYRKGISGQALRILLGLSAGVLFAIATVDLIPEAISIATEPSLEEGNGSTLGATQASEDVEVAHGVALDKQVGGDDDDGGGDGGSAEGGHGDHVDQHHHHDHGNHDATTEHHHEEGKEFAIKVVMIGVGLGFFALLAMEQGLSMLGVTHSHGGGGLEAGHGHSHGSGSPNLSDSFSFTAIAGIALHSVVDGIVIGGAFTVSPDIGSRVSAAIVLHKVPDGFVVASLLTASKRTRRAMWVLLLACMTPLGAVLGNWFLSGIPPMALGAVLGFAAGTFFFIAATGIVPELTAAESLETADKVIPLLGVFVGYVGIVVVDTMFHAH